MHCRRSLGVLLALVLAPSASGQCELDRLLASDGSLAALFGWSVAISGQTAVVGAFAHDACTPCNHTCPDYSCNQGAAYVFKPSGSGWVETARLGASDVDRFPHPGLFGESVAIDGDTVLIGASFSLLGGAAYVFERQGTSWVEVSKLQPAILELGNDFGENVALRGDVAVVGARNDDTFAVDGGVVHVFERTGAAWVLTAQLCAGPGDFRRFGDSVAVSGRTILASERGNDDAGMNAGAVHVFEKLDAGWAWTDVLFASDALPNDSFGVAVSMSENRAVVGTRNRAAAYVFEKQGVRWVETAKLAPPDAETTFGNSVSVAGDVLAVADESSHSFGRWGGAVHVFEKIGADWLRTTRTFASIPGTIFGPGYGQSVAITAEGILVVGAEDDLEIAPAAGAAYVHDTRCEAPWKAFCFGVDCPCGNDYAGGGCWNSSDTGGPTGLGATIRALGSASVAADDLELLAFPVDFAQGGLFIAGTEQVVPGVPVGDGLACIGGATFRFPPTTASYGGVFRQSGFAAMAPGFVRAGETLHFQAWVRDPCNGNRPCPACRSGSNLSNALSVMFAP